MSFLSAPIGLAAPNVTVLNSTSAEITWHPPARHNGILLYYEILRLDVDRNQTHIVNTSLQLSLVVTDMEPYMKYGFQVAASTSGGRTWSDVTEIRTLQDSKFEFCFPSLCCEAGSLCSPIARKYCP
jgi:hypothetical protein